MSEEYASEEIPDYVYEAQRRNAVRRFLKWVIVLVLLGSSAGFAVYVWLGKQRAEADLDALEARGKESAEAFLEDLRNERYDDAYRAASAEFKKRMSRKQFEDYVARHQEQLKEPFQKGEFKAKQTAMAAFGQKVTGKYSGSRKAVAGRQESVTITVLNEDGAIKVQELTISQ